MFLFGEEIRTQAIGNIYLMYNLSIYFLDAIELPSDHQDFPSILGNFCGKFPFQVPFSPWPGENGPTVQGTPMQTLWCDSSMVL